MLSELLLLLVDGVLEAGDVDAPAGVLDVGALVEGEVLADDVEEEEPAEVVVPAEEELEDVATDDEGVALGFG